MGASVFAGGSLTFISIVFSWATGNEYASGTGGLKFKSRAGRIGHSVVNGLPPLQHFFE